MHEKGLPDGTYEMLLFHNNDTSLGIDPDDGSTISYGSGFNIYLDVQLYDPYGTATVDITKVGFQIPAGESWACIQGYSDYKQIEINALTSGSPTYPNADLGLPYYHSFSTNKVVWIGDLMPDNYYSSIPVSSCVYMVVEFKLTNSQGVEVNIAAFKDSGSSTSRFADYQAGYDSDVTAPFIKDYQYKGIADTLPMVEAKLIMPFDDDIATGSNLPVTVFNAIEPGGKTTTRWKTNINPQAEEYYANLSDNSGMMHFTYNDPQKLNAYGTSYSGSKDTVWRFDTEHSDTYQFPSVRDAYNNPNYVLSRPTLINENGESSNKSVAQNLANYGVVYRYNYEIYNYSSEQRTVTFNLETSSNNVIILRYPDDPDNVFFAYYKGENSTQVKDVLNEATIESGYGVGIIVDIVLTTGNPGGISNSVTVVD